ncbi:MAG: UDP-N-acetylmuramate--L-alanine ligase [Crocinitomicaceae bacterium]|nr:UDP-N-acetylmuramate--L-alanine ligase [Crocinitomicaceae bacterium]
MDRTTQHIASFDRAYFIGIGGIGMSALARYFNMKGWDIAGYDKTPSPITKALQEEGISIHFEDLGENLPSQFLETEKTLVVFTPAIPKDMEELVFVQNGNYTVKKRAEVLGMITRDSKALGVAGTHGKTTTSTMLAHILNESDKGCNAFLGGIAANFNSNFVSHPTSQWTVVEADEFDRSFLQLTPYASIVTSTDADHLDIYGDDAEFLEGFKSYLDLINSNGHTILHKDIKLEALNEIRYGLNAKVAFSGWDLRVENGAFLMDVKTPQGNWDAVELGIPGTHNAENALSCIALGAQLGLTEEILRSALKSFKGVKRRFEYHIRTEDKVYIDDYAHHPTEINALLDSVDLMYPNKKVLGIFQPHLFTRTRDFFEGFAEALSRLDDVILLPIYPARELPIEGVTSDALLEKMTSSKKAVLSPVEAVERAASSEFDVILTIGAGDIDRIVLPLKERLENA